MISSLSIRVINFPLATAYAVLSALIMPDPEFVSKRIRWSFLAKSEMICTLLSVE